MYLLIRFESNGFFKFFLRPILTYICAGEGRKYSEQHGAYQFQCSPIIDDRRSEQPISVVQLSVPLEKYLG
jgi:hypothetical protein